MPARAMRAALLSAGALAAGVLAAAAPAQQPGVAATVTTIDGRAVAGEVAVTAAGVVRVTTPDGQALDLALADVLGIERQGVEVDETEGSLYVWLRSGTALPARRIDGLAASDTAPPRLVVDTRAGAHLELPLTSIAALRTRDVEPEKFREDLADPALNKDYFHIVKDGEPQRFSVTVESIHDGLVHFDLRGDKYDFPLRGEDSTAALVFGRNRGFAPDRQAKPRVRAVLATGERVEGKLLALSAAELCVRLDEGAEFRAPASGLHHIDVVTEKLTWLASLAPQVEQTAAFDRAWPWTRDRSPAGPGIVLGGRTFSRGVVLVPRTRLSYRLDGRYDLFEATIGIDDRGGPQAHAVFRVLGDGELLYESEPMTLVTPPRAIRVELGKCDVLAIEADFGKNFDLGDLCAFADARIVQK